MVLMTKQLKKELDQIFLRFNVREINKVCFTISERIERKFLDRTIVTFHTTRISNQSTIVLAGIVIHAAVHV